MKFITYLHNGKPGWGLLDDGVIIDLSHFEPSLKAAVGNGSLADAAGAAANGQPCPWTKFHTCRRYRTLRGYSASARITPRTGMKWAGTGPRTRLFSPVTLPRCRATARPWSSPRKVTNTILKANSPSSSADPGRRISPERALDHIAGYSCFMDGSIRDFQVHTTQYIPGKNFDASGSCGPWMIPAGEMPDPNAGYRLETRLNGATVQSTTTDLMLFPVPALIAYLSTFTTLEPGDIIATGTPGGVGYKREPRLYMFPGDRVEVEVEGIGTLLNIVRG